MVVRATSWKQKEDEAIRRASSKALATLKNNRSLNPKSIVYDIARTFLIEMNFELVNSANGDVIQFKYPSLAQQNVYIWTLLHTKCSISAWNGQPLHWLLLTREVISGNYSGNLISKTLVADISEDLIPTEIQENNMDSINDQACENRIKVICEILRKSWNKQWRFQQSSSGSSTS